jgi:hypothetical protein
MPADTLDELLAEANREHERRAREQRLEDEQAAKIAAAYDAGTARPKLSLVHNQEDAEPRSPFALQPIRIIEPRAIPHRQWIYGHHLIRGFVTLLIAPGGTGKSSLVLGMCMALATNRPLLGSKIFQQCNVALLNLEDPQDEIDRRVTALAMRYGITNQHLDGRLFVSPAGQNVRIAENGPDGFSIVHPDEKQIIEKVRDERIGVLAVDPFAESHTLEENSNPAMIQAAAAWRRVARAGGCSVLLTHHVRKGPVESIEAARGAKALTDSARIGLLLSTMTEAEAEDLGIDPEDRLQYVRLDDAKANMAPRAPKASWFHLNNVTLDNADETYTHGDQVVVIEAWQPPDDELATAPNQDLNKALDAIRDGPEPGVLYTATKRGQSSDRWCGNVLCQMFQTTEKQAAKMIKDWLRSGTLMLTEYRHPKFRKTVPGVTVDDSLRPT